MSNNIVKECCPAAFFKSLARQLKNDGMIRDGILMVVIVFFSQFFTYVYLLVMGIALDARTCGVLYSLSSLFTTIMLLSQVFTSTVSWYTSKIGEEKAAYVLSLVRYFRSRSFFLSAGLFALLIVFGLLKSFLLDIVLMNRTQPVTGS